MVSEEERAPRRGRGRPIGSRGEKRKAPEAYSSNPHTKKARARLEAMTEHEQAVERAKSAWAKAVSRTKSKVLKSAEYQDATEEDKAQILARQMAALREQ